MAIITIPGITDECVIYSQVGDADNFTFTNTAWVAMRHDVYTHYKKHNCVAFIMMDTNYKLTHIRYSTPIDKVHGIFYKSWVIGAVGEKIRVHQFQVELRLLNATNQYIKLVGGFLLGFESEEDLVMFKLTYM